MQTTDHNIKAKKVGGWLLVMCNLLMYVGPAISILGTFARFSELKRLDRYFFVLYRGYEGWSWLIVFISVALSALAGYQLKNELVPETIPKVKQLIWTVFVGGSLLHGFILPYFFFELNADYVASATILIGFAFCVAWGYTRYLSKSRRVQDTFGITVPQLQVATEQGEHSLDTKPAVSPARPLPKDQAIRAKTDDECSGSAMNTLQKYILIGLAVMIFLMLLYPPYRVYGQYSSVSGVLQDSGYDLIFDLPYRATVDVVTLLVQWVGACLIGGLAFLIAKTKSTQS